MSIIGSNILAGASGQAGGGYEIERSVRFNSSDSAYLSRVFSNASASTWTFSAWMKRGALGSAQKVFGDATDGSTGDSGLWLDSDDTLFLSDGQVSPYKTAAVFRDCSAWYHVVATVSSGTTLKIYVNGADQTASGSPNIIRVNSNRTHGIGFNKPTSPSYFNGLLADIHFIDGQALTPSSFGEYDTNNVWQPIAYAGTFGTNGFHLPFSDNSTAAALGTDTSSNGNTWTVNNISVTAGAGNDSLVDSPTNGSQVDTGVGGEVVGNYCTWNPLAKGSDVTLVNGNLDCSTSSTAGFSSVLATIGVTSGKWYWEFTAGSGTLRIGLGIATQAHNLSTWLGGDAYGWEYFNDDGSKATNGAGGAYGDAWTTGDVIGVALDADAGTLTFYKNGATQGQAYSGLTSGPYFPAVADSGTAGILAGSINFGQRPFAHPLSGFKALCTTNLPTPTIADGSQYFQVIKYTGNGTTQTLPNINSEPSSGLNFSPDFVWVKKRSGAENHVLVDKVRGNDAYLHSNLTDAEASASGLLALGASGFDVGNYSGVNSSSTTYVAWTWDAGSSTVTNTQGSITSSVRANASSGFSVVKFNQTSSNQTIGHDLGVEPTFIIGKTIDDVTNWRVYHKSLGASNNLFLNLTNASSSNNDRVTAVSSSTFTCGGIAFGSYGNQIAYCFAPVAGYSSMGKWSGGSDAFVYLGFRPKWLLIKANTAGYDWLLFDSTRSSYNLVDDWLFPNLSDAEVQNNTVNNLDFLSNGFKIKGTSGYLGTAVDMLYVAFAESPFQYARAR
jgi:hypothetical protein